MYIRRKVFSRLEDENGEERYFSTTEYTYMTEAEEERYFAEKEKEEEDEKKAKRKKIAKKVAKGAGIAAGSALALAGAYQLARSGQKKYDDILSKKANSGDGSQRAYRAAMRKLAREEGELGLDRFGHVLEGSVGKAAKATGEGVKKGTKAVGDAAKKTSEFVKETTKKVKDKVKGKKGE